MKTLIFLDDDRNFEDVTWLDYPVFDKIITSRDWDGFLADIDWHKHFPKDVWISFDHDIACYGNRVEEVFGVQQVVEGEIKGDYCCKVAIAEGFNPHQMFVHSRNPAGAANIQRAIDAAKDGWK